MTYKTIERLLEQAEDNDFSFEFRRKLQSIPNPTYTKIVKLNDIKDYLSKVKEEFDHLHYLSMNDGYI